MTLTERIFRWAHPPKFWEQHDEKKPCLCQTCKQLREFIASAVAEERQALVTGLEHLITTGHAEETNMDVALRQARNAGIREAQAAIRARVEAGG